MSTTDTVINCVFNTIAELGDPYRGLPFVDIVDTVKANILNGNILPQPRNVESHTRRAIKYGLQAGIIAEIQKGCFKILDAPRDPEPIVEKDVYVDDVCEKDDAMKYCSSCGGKRRFNKCKLDSRCTRRKPGKCVKRCNKRSKCSKCCKGSGGCGGNRGGCGECRPPPIPRTPCTPPTPRQPCPPSPPCPPKTPCDYFENEGYDCQAGNLLQDDRRDRKSQTPRPINNANCRRSTDALPPENENELALGENHLQLDSNEKEPIIRKLYFGPGSLDEILLINPQEPAEQMDSADPTNGNDSNKIQDLMNEYIS